MIQINFTKQTPSGATYSDALYLPANHTFTEEEIEAMKQKRYDDWYEYITTIKDDVEDPVSEDEIVTEELPQEPEQ